jgi:membrane associated rhomboid family serine protease
MSNFRPSGFAFLPTVVKNLLIINVLFFLATIAAQSVFRIDLADYLGLHYIGASDFQPFQLVTYMFMHGSFAHLFFNMFALWMFGNTLENIWGANRFLLFYFVCGIGAGLVQELVQYIQYATTLQAYTSVNMGGHIIPMGEYLNMLTTVGASGAVYGILLAFGMMFPNSTLYIYFAIPIKAKWFVLLYGVIELFSGLGGAADGVAHFAHLGGMLFGLILILYWKKKGNLY